MPGFAGKLHSPFSIFHSLLFYYIPGIPQTQFGKALVSIKGNKRIIRWAALGLGAYIGLLVLLRALETGRGGGIDTLADALWYSLVTMTTVGYGDKFPVTFGGRLVGTVFMLISTGLLALFIGVALSMLTGRLFPRLRLWRHRRERWYVFSSDNPAARALASKLEDGLVLFCGSTVGLTPEALLELPMSAKGERVCFAMDEDPMANERLAVALKDVPATVYCREDGLNEGLPGNIIPFSEAECAARLYWHARPWRPSGERAVLIGDGRYARALLLQGLLTAPPDCAIDAFGDWSLWEAIHSALNDVPDRRFTLRFHAEPWPSQAELLRTADRVVLCGDAAGENRETLCLLRQYFVLHGQVDVRCSAGLQSAFYFGEDSQIFTPELVMRQSQSRRARGLHELYRSSVDYPVPPWEALSDFLKRSNLAAADHLLTKLRLLLPEADIRELTPEACARAADAYAALDPEGIERCRRIEHSRWALFHALYNWRYAPVRDNPERRHHLLVPYEQLSQEEREKDDNAWLQLRLLAERGIV